MDVIDDIKKLDAYLSTQNIEISDSDSVDTDDLGIDNKSTSRDSNSDEPEVEVDDSFDADPDVKETIENCSDTNLRNAIICNRKKRHILSKMYNKLTAFLVKSNRYYMAKNKQLMSVNAHKFGLKMRLGAPYFKDYHSFPCPLNADAVAMHNDVRMPQFSFKNIPWGRDEKIQLVTAVYEEISEKRLAEISQLMRNQAGTDLLKLKHIFSNKSVIGALARNWVEDTLENVEAKIAKIKSDKDCNTKTNSLRLNVDSEPSTSSTKVNTLKLNLNLGPSTSSAIDNNTRNLRDRLANNIKPKTTKRINLQRKNSCSEFNAFQSTILFRNEKTRSKKPEYWKVTSSSSNATNIDTSTKLAEQGGSSENPKPSTSFAINIELKSDLNESNSSQLENEVMKCEKSLDIIDLDTDFTKHITTISPCEPHENRELIALQEKRTILLCISNWRQQDIDWYQISLNHFDGRHEDFECAALWAVYMNPCISKKPWTNSQSETLKELAVKNDFQNWDLIAQSLNINKTAYQCCVHFHSKLSENFNSDSWTPEEDEELKQIVELCRFGDSVSWGKVAFYLKNRSRVQIYNRYRYALAPVKKGTFSEAEDILLLTLTNIYGKNLSRIGTYFKDRQIPQLRSRLATMGGNIREWSLEDDQAIIQHVHKHGERNWKLLSDLGHNPSHLRHRYNFIKKWFDMNPTAKLDQISRRNKNQHKLRSQTRSQITAPLVEQLTLKAKDHSNKCQILNIPYIERLLKNIPEFKRQPDKVVRRCKSKSKLSLDELLLDYFKPTHKHIGRAITNADNHLDESVERIRLIWSYLNVHLEIPSVEILENHPKLDAYDVKVLSKLKQTPSLKNQMESYVIPPTPETLVGYRGLWLLHPKLCSQSKGKMEGLYYADNKAPLFRKVHGYNVAKNQLEQYLSSLPNKMKQEVLNERQIFWRRFYVLFKWPCLLSILPVIPEVSNTLVESERTGRPKRNTTRVQRLNDAKLETKRKVVKETRDNENIGELSSENLESVKKPKIN